MSFRATVESMSKIMDEMGITELNLERQFLFGVYRKHIHLSKQQAATVAVSAPTSTDKKIGACETKINGYALKSPMVGVVYLAAEYGIGYLAAYEGCSTDSNADADTVIRLARTLDEKGLDFLVVTESSDGTLADSVIRASESGEREVVTLDSLQSVTAKELEEGKNYLDTMRGNLAVLRRMLLP